MALAKVLLERGVAVDVVERRAEGAPELGAGLYLPANAVRALDAIGVGDEVAEYAAPVTRQRLHDHRGRVLTEFAVDRIWGDVGPCLAMARGELHTVLRDAVDGTAVRYETEVHAVTDDGTVTFSDGTGGAATPTSTAPLPPLRPATGAHCSPTSPARFPPSPAGRARRRD
ncbi:FAD-dependent monooxygenase [Streptomyces sp. NPDC058257]|uniref:FAD-dependent monooxygenase n=1 Tax=Streptomyces sp. NPDC058257 TaxID=3346409 RepID=UPI0036E3F2B6